MKAQSFKDKMLPVQPLFSCHFSGQADNLISSIYETAIQFSNKEPFLKKFKIFTSDKFSQEEMGSNPIVLQFLQSLILIKQAKQILEIGTFLGIATLHMAYVLPAEGLITTIEKFDHFAELARKNFLANQMNTKIHLMEGDAFEILTKMDKNKKYDMVFLDGNKERYADYFKVLDPKIEKGGLLIADDVFFHGDVFNASPVTDKGKGVKQFLEETSLANHYHKTILPLSNGIMIMIKT